MDGWAGLDGGDSLFMGYGPPNPLLILGSPEYRSDYTEIRLAECFENTIVYTNKRGKLLKFEMVLRN